MFDRFPNTPLKLTKLNKTLETKYSFATIENIPKNKTLLWKYIFKKARKFKMLQRCGKNEQMDRDSEVK